MRKLSVYALSAAAAVALSAAAPVTSLAAVSAYQIPFSGGSAYVIGIGSQNCLPGTGSPNGSWQPGQNIWQPDQNWNWGQDGNGGTGALPEEDENLTPDEDMSLDSYAAAVADLVNAERARAGLKPLAIHTGAAKAADTRAREIQTSFSHTRPDGSHFSTALTQAGVSYRSAGENIAYGQRTPEAVMESWMNSQGHRANILNPDYTSIGVGHIQDGNGTHYWTQLFIK